MEWLTSPPGRLPPGKTPDTNRTGGWEGLSAGQDVLWNRKIFALAGTRTPACLARNLVIIKTTLFQLPISDPIN